MHVSMLVVDAIRVVHLALLNSCLLGWIQAVIGISTIESG